MHRLKKFLRRPWSDQGLLLEALWFLTWSKLAIHTLPFRWIAPRYGRKMTESPWEIDEATLELARKISWAVEVTAHHVPLRFVCLPQAMAAKWMLRRRGVASTLYLGLRHKDESDLTAHAWLRVGQKILTGKKESLTHQPLAWFAEAGK